MRDPVRSGRVTVPPPEDFAPCAVPVAEPGRVADGGHGSGSQVGAAPPEPDSVAGRAGAPISAGVQEQAGVRRHARLRPDVDDVRAPSTVAEVDDVDDVEPPDWLCERPDRDGGDGLPSGRFGSTRVDPGRRGALTLAVVGLIAVVVTAFVVMRERPVSYPVPPLASVPTTTGPAAPVTAATPEPDAPVNAGGAGELVVSVVGLVHRGGLVRLPEGARVADAVAAAGGAREGADLTGLNLAQRVRDGDQILVGAAQQDGGPSQPGSATISGSGTVPGAQDSAPGVGTTGTVDLNSATEAELDALPGVGPVTARAILSWRSANGRFTSIDQLAEVDGIGPTRLARLRDQVRI